MYFLKSKIRKNNFKKNVKKTSQYHLKWRNAGLQLEVLQGYQKMLLY